MKFNDLFLVFYLFDFQYFILATVLQSPSKSQHQKL